MTLAKHTRGASAHGGNAERGGAVRPVPLSTRGRALVSGERVLWTGPLSLAGLQTGAQAPTVTLRCTTAENEVRTALLEPQGRREIALSAAPAFLALDCVPRPTAALTVILKRANDEEERGVVVLAAICFGDAGLEESIASNPVARGLDALGWLARQPEVDDQAWCFPDAGHRIGLPGGSTAEHARESLGEKSWFEQGGTPAGAAAAERAAHDALCAFIGAQTPPLDGDP